jgi:glycosyltransferase involved in cell wall biosynthesis
MPVYNAEPYLAEAIDGILNQSYEHFELVICDNASTDRSAEIAKSKSAGSPKIRFYQNQWNIGFSGNMQKATSLAQGDFLLVHAADDVMLPGALQALVDSIQQAGGDPQELVICSDFFVINERGERRSRLTISRDACAHITVGLDGDNTLPQVENYKGRMLLKRQLATLSTFGWVGANLFSRRLYEQVEGCYSNHWINPDKQFMFKLLTLDPRVVWLRQPLFCYRLHETNQNAQQAATGILKYPLDEYAYTFEFPREFYEQYGPGKDAVIDWFVDRDCLETALRELAVGSRGLGFRYLCFALATYPERAWKNSKTLLALLVWLTGPLGRWLAGASYRSQFWRRWWRFPSTEGIDRR